MVGGCQLNPRKKRYEGVRFNVISITTGWVGVKFPGKKRYVTLEWPLILCRPYTISNNERRGSVVVSTCMRLARGWSGSNQAHY